MTVNDKSYAAELLFGFERRVQTNDANVLLAGALLRLDEARGTINAHDQRSGHFWIQRSAVARLLHAQYAFDPRHNYNWCVARRARSLKTLVSKHIQSI
jgi:hypothetical protein